MPSSADRDTGAGDAYTPVASNNPQNRMSLNAPSYDMVRDGGSLSRAPSFGARSTGYEPGVFVRGDRGDDGLTHWVTSRGSVSGTNGSGVQTALDGDCSEVIWSTMSL